MFPDMQTPLMLTSRKFSTLDSGGVATFVVVFNALLVTGWEDFRWVHHDPLVRGYPLLYLPLAGFTLTSPALGLLLGRLPFPNTVDNGRASDWYADKSHPYPVLVTCSHSLQNKYVVQAMG